MKYLVFRIFLIQYFGLQLNLFLRKRQILFITSHMLFIYLQINSTDAIGTELNLFAGAESGNSDCTGNKQIIIIFCFPLIFLLYSIIFKKSFQISFSKINS